jgi:hypothetical protein
MMDASDIFDPSPDVWDINQQLLEANTTLEAENASLRAELEAAREQLRWIPMSERLPDKGEVKELCDMSNDGPWWKRRAFGSYTTYAGQDVWAVDDEYIPLWAFSHWRDPSHLPSTPEEKVRLCPKDLLVHCLLQEQGIDTEKEADDD